MNLILIKIVMFLFIISKETSLLINIISFFSYISIGDLMEEFRKVMDTEYYTYYTVNKGDTLYSISKKFNVNPKLVSELNGLKVEEYIYPNQTIIIPKKGIQYYITKDDDTLNLVSKVFGANESDIVKQNKTIYLLPGQMIFYRE